MIPPPIDTVGYETLDAAALAAEQATEKISFDSGYEFGGVLLERDGKFYYTIAGTSKDPTHLELRVGFPSTYHMVGLYHTHPAGHEGETSRWFSPEDIRVAKTLRVPSYIGVQYEQGAVRKYIPNVSRTESEMRADYPRGLISLGETVKWTLR